MTNFIKPFSLTLLMGSAFIANAMDFISNTDSNIGDASGVAPKKQAVKVNLSLTETIKLFEKGEWVELYKGFKGLCKAGGIIGSAYMEYMEQIGYVDPSVVYGHIDIELIPEIGQALSKEYLKASLAYMESDKTLKIRKLAAQIVSCNAHAINLMYRLCKEDGTIFGLLKASKEFKSVEKKYKTPEDLFNNFVAEKSPMMFWNCVDPDYFVFLYKNKNTSPLAKNFTETELSYFATNYERNPHWLVKLALKLATTNDLNKVSQPLFWAHLALENGCGNLCGQLGRTFLDQMVKMKVSHVKQKERQVGKLSLSSEQRACLELSYYYSSHIENGDLLPINGVVKLLQSHGRDYERGSYGNPDKFKSFLFDK